MNYDEALASMMDSLSALVGTLAKEYTKKTPTTDTKKTEAPKTTSAPDKASTDQTCKAKNNDTLSNLAAIVSTIYDDIKDLKERMTAEEATSDCDAEVLATLETKLNDLSSEVSYQSKILDKLAADVENLKDEIDDIDEACADFYNKDEEDDEEEDYDDLDDIEDLAEALNYDKDDIIAIIKNYMHDYGFSDFEVSDGKGSAFVIPLDDKFTIQDFAIKNATAIAISRLKDYIAGKRQHYSEELKTYRNAYKKGQEISEYCVYGAMGKIELCEEMVRNLDSYVDRVKKGYFK